jgi:hypothetical protein
LNARQGVVIAELTELGTEFRQQSPHQGSHFGRHLSCYSPNPKCVDVRRFALGRLIGEPIRQPELGSAQLATIANDGLYQLSSGEQATVICGPRKS